MPLLCLPVEEEVKGWGTEALRSFSTVSRASPSPLSAAWLTGGGAQCTSHIMRLIGCEGFMENIMYGPINAQSVPREDCDDHEYGLHLFVKARLPLGLH